MYTSHADILGKYGITEQEIMVELPIRAWIENEGSVEMHLCHLYTLNDSGWTFDQIADYL